MPPSFEPYHEMHEAASRARAQPIGHYVPGQMVHYPRMAHFPPHYLDTNTQFTDPNCKRNFSNLLIIFQVFIMDYRKEDIQFFNHFLQMTTSATRLQTFSRPPS